MQLYNTLSKQKEPFSPLVANNVTIYVCGITPYDTTHVGHAFTYISFDVLVRYLRYKGNKVTYTQNVTDMNDRDNDILERAKQQNISWQDLADFWTKKFLHDMKELNWVMPTNYLYASKNIPEMIVLIEKLIKNNHAYVINGNVYLDITQSKTFGSLSGLNHEEMLPIAKVFEEDIENPEKKRKLDVTLWRASSPNQPQHIPSFDSPFSKGRPGWHIECSAMAIGSLGEQIDIHGGGRDLLYPHHESEIAQSEGATGKIPFANYWLHSGTVSYRGKKMSKSLGNLVLISDLLQHYSANAVRFVLLSHHYRSSWEFFEEELQSAENSIKNLQEKAKEDIAIPKYIEQAFDNDLDIPTVLTLLQKEQVVPKSVLSLLGFIL